MKPLLSSRVARQLLLSYPIFRLVGTRTDRDHVSGLQGMCQGAMYERMDG